MQGFVRVFLDTEQYDAAKGVRERGICLPYAPRKPSDRLLRLDTVVFLIFFDIGKVDHSATSFRFIPGDYIIAQIF